MKIENSEFWGPLLEKAYAKFHGSYGAIDGGSVTRVICDFTGGKMESYDLKNNPPSNLFSIIRDAFEKGSVVGATIGKAPSWHSFLIKNARVAESAENKQLELLKIKNTSGSQWQCKEILADAANASTEEFDINYADFLRHFDNVTLCHISSGSEMEKSDDKSAEVPMQPDLQLPMKELDDRLPSNIITAKESKKPKVFCECVVFAIAVLVGFIMIFVFLVQWMGKGKAKLSLKN